MEENGQTTLRSDLLDRCTEIVSAYVGNNAVAQGDLTQLITSVHGALAEVASPAPPPQKPAVSVRKSVTPDHIICLEDGERFKSLRRHLATSHGLTPEEYRTKWNLPADFPMTAPNYSIERSKMAKKIGLGRKPSSRRASRSTTRRRRS